MTSQAEKGLMAGMAGTVNVTLDEFITAIENIAENIEEELGKNLFYLAWDIMAESLQEIPWDTGYAKSTHFVDKPVLENGRWTVKLGYRMTDVPGGGKPYIYYIHEYDYDFKKPGTKRFFLRDPVRRAKNKVENLVADTIEMMWGLEMRGKTRVNQALVADRIVNAGRRTPARNIYSRYKGKRTGPPRHRGRAYKRRK